MNLTETEKARVQQVLTNFEGKLRGDHSDPEFVDHVAILLPVWVKLLDAGDTGTREAAKHLINTFFPTYFQLIENEKDH